MSVDVAIIGGGVSGLAAAYDLRRRGHRVAVLERQVGPGGNAVSEGIGGFLMEHGPSTMNAMYAAAGDYSRELGLDGARCDLGDGIRQRYLVAAGRLRPIAIHPLGFFLSDYLSLRARLRLFAEIAVPRRTGGPEETVAAFCARRFGSEFAERVIDPLVGGLYAGRAGELSMPAVFPRLVEMERDYRSVSLAVMRQRRRGGKMPGSRLFSWRGGIATLPRALACELGEAVHTGVAVRRIVPVPGGYLIEAGRAGTLRATAVVLATQPSVAAGLLEHVDPTAAEAAGGIEAPPLAVTFLGFRREQVSHPLDGLGYLTPPAEGRVLTGAQFCSTMFPGRAPDGCVAVAGYFGGARAPDVARRPAAELVALAREEFRDLIGARGEPVIARVRHWPLGLPQYRLGHAGRTADLRELAERKPGLFVTGNYFGGPSVAVCLVQARETAARVHGFLSGLGDRVEATRRAG